MHSCLFYQTFDLEYSKLISYLENFFKNNKEINLQISIHCLSEPFSIPPDEVLTKESLIVYQKNIGDFIDTLDSLVLFGSYMSDPERGYSIRSIICFNEEVPSLMQEKKYVLKTGTMYNKKGIPFFMRGVFRGPHISKHAENLLRIGGTPPNELNKNPSINNNSLPRGLNTPLDNPVTFRKGTMVLENPSVDLSRLITKVNQNNLNTLMEESAKSNIPFHDYCKDLVDKGITEKYNTFLNCCKHNSPLLVAGCSKRSRCLLSGCKTNESSGCNRAFLYCLKGCFYKSNNFSEMVCDTHNIPYSTILDCTKTSHCAIDNCSKTQPCTRFDAICPKGCVKHISYLPVPRISNPPFLTEDSFKSQ